MAEAEHLWGVFSDAGERFSSENARRFAQSHGIEWSAAGVQEVESYLRVLLGASSSLRAG